MAPTSGVRGIGATQAAAFEQARWQTDRRPDRSRGVAPRSRVEIRCAAPDDEVLLVDLAPTRDSLRNGNRRISSAASRTISGNAHCAARLGRAGRASRAHRPRS